MRLLYDETQDKSDDESDLKEIGASTTAGLVPVHKYLHQHYEIQID